MDSLQMRGGPWQADLWVECEFSMHTFKEDVDGMTGALAFFTAITPDPDASPPSPSFPRGIKKRRRGT